MLERCLAEQGALAGAAAPSWPTRSAALRDTDRPAVDRLHAGTDPRCAPGSPPHPFREMVSPSPAYRLLVERELALFGAWYEIFPRSEGAYLDAETGEWRSGTLRTAAERLPRHRRDGLRRRLPHPDPPHRVDRAQGQEQHPQRGARATPGSPYAIGSPDGGHDSIHPDLGHLRRLRPLRARGSPQRASRSPSTSRSRPPPTTPTSRPTPSGSRTRADGTIAYAENPPKKYQDIYPLNFDNDPAGVLRRDAPRHPGVDRPRGHAVPRRQPAHQAGAVLAVADRRRGQGPPRDHLAVRGVHEAGDDAHARPRPGFQQSYTYYAWRNMRWELEEYLTGAGREAAAYMRPSFWPTTHDILTPYMQYGGPTAWTLRAALAATLVPTYGIYAGYELMENVARQGAEEQVDNEKYEYKNRHWEDYEPGGAKEGQSLSATSPGSTRSARRTPRCAGCATSVPLQRRREHHRLLQVAGPVRRHARTPSSSSPTSTRTRPVALARPRHAGPRPRLARQFRARDLITEQTWTGAALWSGSGPRPTPSTSSRSGASERAGPQPAATRSATRPAVVPDCGVLRGPGPRVLRLQGVGLRVTSAG